MKKRMNNQMRQVTSKFLTPQDIASLTGRSESYAYKLIKRLNAELSHDGFITIRGRVPAKYFYKRVFGGDEQGE